MKRKTAEEEEGLENEVVPEGANGPLETGTQDGAASHFIPARTFEGPRPGFAFKTGPLGTGYYLETSVPSGATVPASRSLASQGAVSSPQVCAPRIARARLSLFIGVDVSVTHISVRVCGFKGWEGCGTRLGVRC